jgi:hypothetical protein
LQAGLSQNFPKESRGQYQTTRCHNPDSPVSEQNVFKCKTYQSWNSQQGRLRVIVPRLRWTPVSALSSGRSSIYCTRMSRFRLKTETQPSLRNLVFFKKRQKLCNVQNRYSYIDVVTIL